MDLLPVQVPKGTVKIGDVVCTWQTRKRGPSVVMDISPQESNGYSGREITLMNASNRTRKVAETMLMSYAAVVFNQYAEFEAKFTGLQAFTKKIPLLLARRGIAMPYVPPASPATPPYELLPATMAFDVETPL